MNKKNNIYRNFHNTHYLNEYYTKLSAENKQLLDFLHWAYEIIPPFQNMLDVGTGPTIYQLISASRKANEIHCAEYSSEARIELKNWKSSAKSSISWDNFFKYVLHLEKKAIDPADLEEIKARTRETIKEIIFCDINRKPPVKTGVTYDVVSSFFCIESVTTTQDDFEFSLENIRNLINGGGFLIMALLENASHWESGPKKYNSFPVNEKFLTKKLKSLGGTIKKIQTHEVKEHTSCEGHIVVLAQFT